MPCVQNLESGTDLLLLNNSGKGLSVEWLTCSTSRLQDAIIRMQKQLGVQLPLKVNCLSRSSEHPKLHCDESYQLEVDTNNRCIAVHANTEWGILRSFATLSQLIQCSADSARPTSIRSCKIKDNPDFTGAG